MASPVDKPQMSAANPSPPEESSPALFTPELWQQIERVLKPLASLRLTVVLFLLSIFIVLAGTFAQVKDDIWTVVHEYFRVDISRLVTSDAPWLHLGELFVWIKADVFFPESFFPKNPPLPRLLSWMAPIWPDGTIPMHTKLGLENEIGIWFPKGWTIGIVMALNLLAAHTLRFKVQASGLRLKVGSGILALGAIFTYLVILSGSNPEGLQSKPLVSYDILRMLMLTTTFGVCGAAIYGTFALPTKEKKWMSGIGAVLLALTAMFVAWWEPGDEASMRILYQLVKASFASLILLAGCIAVFKRRAGIVLLHGGIALMMFYDVLVGTQHIESQMTILEGETSNFSRDIRSVEFAVIDRSGQSEDLVTVVPGSLLSKAGAQVRDPRLPFDLEVLAFYRNSDVRGLRSFGPNEKIPDNPATRGIGDSVVAVPVENVKGTDTGGRVDVPSLYVKLLSKSGEELGVWLTSSIFDLSDGRFGQTQQVSVDGKNYDIALRFVRHYNPYFITLNDVQKQDYKGTSKVKDYSSYITLRSPEEDLEFDYRIWMNNPMRFAGKTFYQSNYGVVEGGREFTTLQVVDNIGWMTPYVSCMIVWFGMMYHFGQTLLRYLARRARQIGDENRRVEALLNASGSDDPEVVRQRRMEQLGWAVTAAICGTVLLSIVRLGMPPREKPDQFHISAFSELPMWYRGRPMPFDSYARNTLLKLSDYESYRTEDGKKQPAIEWLLKVMSDDVAARDVRIFKIENKDVIEALGLEDRPRFTYSFNELLHSDKVDGIKEMGMLTILRDLEGLTTIDPQKPRQFNVAASETPAEERSLFQRKIIELARKIDDYVLFEFAVGGGRIIDLMQAKDPDANRQPAIAELGTKLREFKRLHETAFNAVPIPLMVPTHFDAENRPDAEAFQTDWEPLTSAKVFDKIYDELKSLDAGDYTKPGAIVALNKITSAYAAGDVETFNSQLHEYEKFLRQHAREGDDKNLISKTEFEAFYNRFGAFNLASWLYVVAGILAAVGWLVWPQVFQRAALWMIATIFIIHTAALIGRIYISGRPPVTNLYSSAIFIGWAVVLGGLILEVISRLGVANMVSAAAGFLALRIADGLASDGDTFVVLEAVLDTQFWLATHVVCITLGYAATYLAGLFGLMYLFLGVCTPLLSQDKAKEISRMLYGVLCFATFFSFVGTVLGGLWADDSWGRFWGWDPKENGALIIVIWNALVLHARWGNLIKERGVAVLAVLGNIVVSWSWFGVNELGVGLHSYGFTEGRLAVLALFAFSQLTVAFLGCLPKSCWWSQRSGALPSTESTSKTATV